MKEINFVHILTRFETNPVYVYVNNRYVGYSLDFDIALFRNIMSYLDGGGTKIRHYYVEPINESRIFGQVVFPTQFHLIDKQYFKEDGDL